MVLFSLATYAQPIPCTLTGPGSDVGGTAPTTCGTIGNYSFQHTDGSVCDDLGGNTPTVWSWGIENLGPTGFVFLTQNTTYPVFFTMSNGIEGEILGASNVSITIKWNCNGCVDVPSHITIYPGTAEIYQSSVFVDCVKDCSYNSWDCISTDCDCVQACVNGTLVTLNNLSGGELFFCYPEGTAISNVTPCGTSINCGKKDDVKLLRDNEDAKLVQIPDVKLMQSNIRKGGTSLTIQLPESNQPFDVLISDSFGRTTYSEKLRNQTEATIELDNLAIGIYHILITDGNYRITQKIFIN